MHSVYNVNLKKSFKLLFLKSNEFLTFIQHHGKKNSYFSFYKIRRTIDLYPTTFISFSFSFAKAFSHQKSNSSIISLVYASLYILFCVYIFMYLSKFISFCIFSCVICFKYLTLYFFFASPYISVFVYISVFFLP